MAKVPSGAHRPCLTGCTVNAWRHWIRLVWFSFFVFVSGWYLSMEEEDSFFHKLDCAHAKFQGTNEKTLGLLVVCICNKKPHLWLYCYTNNKITWNWLNVSYCKLLKQNKNQTNKTVKPDQKNQAFPSERNSLIPETRKQDKNKKTQNPNTVEKSVLNCAYTVMYCLPMDSPRPETHGAYCSQPA